MTCPVCSAPVESGDLCPGCAAKTTRVRPAGRFLVDRAARRALAVADKAIRTSDSGDALAEYTVSGFGAGRRW